MAEVIDESHWIIPQAVVQLAQPIIHEDGSK
jgi:hypothetical protein